jgi:hypothetical protein
MKMIPKTALKITTMSRQTTNIMIIARVFTAIILLQRSKGAEAESGSA